MEGIAGSTPLSANARIRLSATGKKIDGRKRHIVTDTLGLMVGLVVHGANVQDRDGSPEVLKSIRARWPWPRHVFEDGGYPASAIHGRQGDWRMP